MAVRDFTSQRVFLNDALAVDARIACTPEQASYLRAVLRMPDGAGILVFNGRDGEWRAVLRHDGKRGAALEVVDHTRQQTLAQDLWYLFAPLKRSRLDYMVQKAVEMGVNRLMPVLTQHTQAERVNLDRMHANAIEAAEQCGVLVVPQTAEPKKLADVLGAWPPDRRLVFCDEAAAQKNPIETLQALPRGPLAVLIGPEGGFSDTERAMILAMPAAVPLSLGPRIMRADTAAVAALAVVNGVLGDWS
jgi:16S rRNA (uracil1498-N3)-methyltransferase